MLQLPDFGGYSDRPEYMYYAVADGRLVTGYCPSEKAVWNKLRALYSSDELENMIIEIEREEA